jgi:hypothetical protein
MGQEKEAQILREEQAREHAKREGHICAACTQPLFTEYEQSEGLCIDCLATMPKDD